MPTYLPDRYNPEMKDDKGYIETEDILFDMVAEIESVYGLAYEEMYAKAKKFLEWFTVADRMKRKLVESKDMSISEYNRWRNTYMWQGRQTYAMVDTLADDLVNKDKIAASIINGYMPEVYAINGNYITYTIEKATNINVSFTLFDEQTVERLIREKPNLLPKATVDIPKDKRWNKEHLTSAITQGIIQGETTDEIAERLAAVTDMDKNAAVRNAATMTTSAQNGGRVEGMKRAEDMGIQLKQKWIATLDGHTRYTHRQCDGELREIGKKFSNGLLYPGDPAGRPAEVYNCRCVISALVENQLNDVEDRDNRLQGMSYEEWKNAKGNEPLFKAAKNENRDYDMHEEYRKLLGKRVPSTLSAFQDFKYHNREEWRKMVSDARKARNARRRKNAG